MVLWPVHTWPCAQLFPLPRHLIICRPSNSSPKGPFSVSFSTPSSMSTRMALARSHSSSVSPFPSGSSSSFPFEDTCRKDDGIDSSYTLLEECEACSESAISQNRHPNWFPAWPIWIVISSPAYLCTLSNVYAPKCYISAASIRDLSERSSPYCTFYHHGRILFCCGCCFIFIMIIFFLVV